MPPELEQQILEEYRKKRQLYGTYGSKLQRLLEELVRNSGVMIHSVSGRTKDEESLRKKLVRPGGKYATLSDVTDICGVRVITYFAEEVDKVAALIETEFDIDKRNSVDKRKALDPDQFGYLSVHYIARLKANRLGLGEYAAYKECVAEIQLRSILQHAWAEIEHDLGYKSEAGVPRDLQRQFSRLAGLLEIADDGFTSLRKDLTDYSQSVSGKIKNQPEELLIDSVSLLALIDSDPSIKEFDQKILRLSAGRLTEPRDLDRHATAAIRLGFKTIGELKAAMVARRESWRQFIEAFWQGRAVEGTLPTGISLYYFLVFYAMQDGGADRLFEAYFEGRDDLTNRGPFFYSVLRAFDASKPG